MTNSKMPDPESGNEALALPPMSRGMQVFAMVLVFLLGAAIAAFLVGNPFGLSFLPGGGGDAETMAATEPVAEQLYQCPMHPEVIESGPADCPICGMDLVAMEQTQAAEHDHGGHGSDPLYICPMHPEVIQAEPGDCPICGMDLVAQKQDQPMDSGGSGVIEIDPVQVQNIGVVSVVSRVEDIARSSRTVGILDFNADRITWINTKFAGWIEKVHVNYVGQDVRKGDPLFEIYSPELVTTQEEYLRALDYRASLERSERLETRQQAESLLRSTRDRLAYWDISEDQIVHLEETREVHRRLTVASPVDGVVAQVMDQSLEGMFVKPGMDLYKITDLSTVWVHADVYESDLPWIRKGQPAVVTFRHDPGRTVRGNVLFLYPEVSKETRTLKICVEAPNRDRRLRPGMYADVVIQGPPVRDAVVVPQSAVLRSGERDLVFVDLGEGRFEPREVHLGVKGAEDKVQIRHGLTPGEAVVTQAQFMLDSESRLQEAIAKFRQRGTAGAGTPPPTGHQH